MVSVLHRACSVIVCFLCLLSVQLAFAPLTVNAAELYTNTIEINNVGEVEIRGGVKAVISQGENEFLRATATKSVLEKVVVAKDGSKLIISVEKEFRDFFDQNKPAEFVIQLKQPKDVALHGSVELTVGHLSVDKFSLHGYGSGPFSLGDINAKELNINLNGSHNLEFSNLKVQKIKSKVAGSGTIQGASVMAKNAEIEIAGSGFFKISEPGEITTMTLSLSGSGNYYAEATKAQTAQITVAGSGNAHVNVSDQIDAEIYGAGNIQYLGNPNVEEKIFGAGTVSKIANAQ